MKKLILQQRTKDKKDFLSSVVKVMIKTSFDHLLTRDEFILDWKLSIALLIFDYFYLS